MTLNFSYRFSLIGSFRPTASLPLFGKPFSASFTRETMIIKPRAVTGFLRNPSPMARAVLVFGRDEGMVREYVETLMNTVVEDRRDPFRVADIRADSLKDDRARLADEAAAISMTGGRRVIRVRAATNAHTGLFVDFLANPPGDALVVVEGGDLAKSSALRKAFEEADYGAVLPCYSDEGVDLEHMIVDHLRERHGLRADSGAVSFLAERLGSDRMLTRQELDKLALYMGPGHPGTNGTSESKTITVEDAQEAVGDSAAVQLDQIVFAAAGGELPILDRALARHLNAGESPIPVLRALSRHLERLQLVRAATDNGQPLNGVLKTLRPPVFFKQEKAFTRQARLWSGELLKTALQITLDAELDCKTTGLPAETVCGRALLRIAVAARSRSAAA